MLRYRALLIDTAAIQERPVQQFFSTLEAADDWATKVLARAHEHAEVVMYSIQEREIGKIYKSDLEHDKGTEPGIQPADE